MKVAFNIEKRHAYAIIGLIIVLVGVVIINAAAPIPFANDVTGVGHGADEIGPGIMQGPIAVYEAQAAGTLLRLGNVFDFAGIYSEDLPGSATPESHLTLGAEGDVYIGNPQTSALESVPSNTANLIIKHGDIQIKNGKKLVVDSPGQICLGSDCRSSWSSSVISCDWTGWASTGFKSGAKFVGTCSSGYVRTIDAFCQSGKVTQMRYIDSTDCE
jgi:hypothetical protein